VRKPQVIPDEDHEIVYQRVAAVDVAKASGMVCVRTPDARGRYASRVWEVRAATGQVLELGRMLLKEKIEMVTLEATSDYWRIWFYLLESLGLAVQLVSPAQAKNLKGRPKTDKLDSMWLARLTQQGMLLPCFVPPSPIRALRDYTRMRADLVRERTRCWQRLEKLLEGALIKVTSVASKITTLSVQDMIRALIAGERDPRVLAGLARGRMRSRQHALEEALTGMFDVHHGEIAQMELDQIAWLDGKIATLEARARDTLEEIPQSWGADATGETGPQAGMGADARVLPAVARLAEIPGVSENLAVTIIAETGLDMARFPTAAHLVSWAGMCPTANQSGPGKRKDKKNHGDSYLRSAMGQAATGASKTLDSFLSERFRRVSRRRGPAIAQVAVGRSILIIIWHLLASPGARYTDLGAGYYTSRISTDKKARNHIRQLEALGLEVTVTKAAA
jgi:transposase